MITNGPAPACITRWYRSRSATAGRAGRGAVGSAGVRAGRRAWDCSPPAEYVTPGPAPDEGRDSNVPRRRQPTCGQRHPPHGTDRGSRSARVGRTRAAVSPRSRPVVGSGRARAPRPAPVLLDAQPAPLRREPVGDRAEDDDREDADRPVDEGDRERLATGRCRRRRVRTPTTPASTTPSPAGVSGTAVSSDPVRATKNAPLIPSWTSGSRAPRRRGTGASPRSPRSGR